MGYLDELSAIFGGKASDDGSGTIEAEVVGTPLDTARRQLTESHVGYREDPEGTFTASGSRFGCGYATARTVVDAETGLATVDINSHLRIPAEQAKSARKLFRRLNQSFIIPGLAVGDDGCMHFVSELPCDLADDGDLLEYLGKGFSSVHAHAHMVTQLQTGRAAWDILQDAKAEEDGDVGDSIRDRLRQLFE